jgi:hypothetical protein
MSEEVGVETKIAARQAVEEIARRALALSFEGKPESVPVELVKAVAKGEGDRRQVRQLEPEGKPLALLRFDADRIAEFVFESSRPPVVAGASAILRALNRLIGSGEADPTTRQLGLEDPLLARWVVYSGGGDGLLLVPASEAAAIARTLEGLFARATRGALGVTVAWVEASVSEFLEQAVGEALREESEGVRLVSGTPALLSRLHDRIRVRKDAQPLRSVPVLGDLRCESCRDRAARPELSIAELFGREAEGANSFLCVECENRWRVGRTVIERASFEAVAEAVPDGRGRADRLGLLYADGNGLGALFQRLRSLAELRFLSRAVTAVFAGLDERVRSRFGELAARAGAPELPWISLLAGGDEGIWILPAAVAVDVAERLPAWLAEQERAVPGLRAELEGVAEAGLSVGMGLTLASYAFPVRYQYELAQQLQKNAKKRAVETPTSWLDFHEVVDASPMSGELEKARTLLYGTDEPGFLRTGRPYRAAGLSGLRERLREAQAAQVSSSQLRGLARAAREGQAVFLNTLRYQLGRSGGVGDSWRAWLREAGLDPAESQAVTQHFVPKTPGAASGLWLEDALELEPYFLERERT